MGIVHQLLPFRAINCVENEKFAVAFWVWCCNVSFSSVRRPDRISRFVNRKECDCVGFL